MSFTNSTSMTKIFSSVACLAISGCQATDNAAIVDSAITQNGKTTQSASLSFDAGKDGATQYVMASDYNTDRTNQLCRIALPNGIIGENTVLIKPARLSHVSRIRLGGRCETFNNENQKNDNVEIYFNQNYTSSLGLRGDYSINIMGPSVRGKFDGPQQFILHRKKPGSGYTYNADDNEYAKFFTQDFVLTRENEKAIYFSQGTLFAKKEEYRASLDTTSPLLDAIDISVKTSSDDLGGKKSNIFLEYAIKPLDAAKLSKYDRIDLVFKVRMNNKYRGGAGIVMVFKEQEFSEEKTVTIHRSSGFVASGKEKVTEIVAQSEDWLTGEWRLDRSDLTVNIIGINPQ